MRRDWALACLTVLYLCGLHLTFAQSSGLCAGSYFMCSTVQTSNTCQAVSGKQAMNSCLGVRDLVHVFWTPPYAICINILYVN